ncbi:MAG: hypothetical protein ACLFUC_06605 [Bacteroidales bacterium]
MKIENIAISFIFILAFSPGIELLHGQSLLDTASIEQQVTEIIDEANVYNDYKVIRNSTALKLKSNVLDSIGALKGQLNNANQTIQERESEIGALQEQLDQTEESLARAIDTKRSLMVLGIEVDKAIYNTTMWTLLIITIGAIAILFVMYKRSHVVTTQTKKDLYELKEEHERYRKESRERLEQTVVKYHNEIKKLKKSS